MFGSDTSDDEDERGHHGLNERKRIHIGKPSAALTSSAGPAVEPAVDYSSSAHTLLTSLLSEHTELTTAVTTRDAVIAKTQQDASAARKEVTRLRSELTKKDGELVKVNKALVEEKKKFKGKGKAVVHHSTLPDTKIIYTTLIANVTTAYKAKEATLIKKYAACAPTPPPLPPCPCMA